MLYLLDTDILSLMAHEDSPEAPRIRRRIVQLDPDDSTVTSIINFEEQYARVDGSIEPSQVTSIRNPALRTPFDNSGNVLPLDGFAI